MPTRRNLMLTVGGLVSVAGCTGPSANADARTSDGGETTSTDKSDDPVSPAESEQGPTGTVRQFYRALITADVESLNATLVHPESPTYPLKSHHLPPDAFQKFSEVTIGTTEEVSVQDMVVQRLFPNVTQTLDMKRAMNVDEIQYVHTTFYLKKPDEEQAYEANTVDYTVRDDDQWYVRYNVSRSTHGSGDLNQTASPNGTA